MDLFIALLIIYLVALFFVGRIKGARQVFRFHYLLLSISVVAVFVGCFTALSWRYAFDMAFLLLLLDFLFVKWKKNNLA